MQLYIEGYLQAMLDTVYKQEYLRVRVIDNQVILPFVIYVCIISIRNRKSTIYHFISSFLNAIWHFCIKNDIRC